ncbi:hypothetical protein EG68_08895 [Paragonimus skrjabini miyazakii]|uniref:ANK_REP_REGION domain-containing protein n=1 Tax=Paragonimus skrjabini miyazakii TaxID=59628 RepID=A0A8S9Y9C9_9TREM|nr:hypothetical protein EG68_08895 [Paragonimus skrjabini miyazakii]
MNSYIRNFDDLILVSESVIQNNFGTFINDTLYRIYPSDLCSQLLLEESDPSDGDTIKMTEPLKLPKLKADTKLTVRESIATLSKMSLAKDISNSQTRCLVLIQKHVSATCVVNNSSLYSKYMQVLREWATIPECCAAFMQFLLSVSNSTLVIERLARIRKFLSTDFSQYITDLSKDGEDEHFREKFSKYIMVFLLPELTDGHFKPLIEVKKCATSINQSDIQSALMYYISAFWDEDSSILCKILIAPLFKSLSGEVVSSTDYNNLCIYRPDTQSYSENKVIKTSLMLRAFGLLYCAYDLLKLFTESPEAVSGGYTIPYLHTSGVGKNDVRDVSASLCAFLCIRKGYLSVLKFLIEAGKIRLATCIDPDGRNLLIAAVSAGQVEIAKYLITEPNPPININAKCESGNTALHVAVAQNNLKLAKLLLDAGGALVDITNTNCDGATPLHMAALFGYSDMVDLLVGHSARLDVRTTPDHRDGLTASQLAQLTENERLSAHLCKLATDMATHFVNDQTSNRLFVRQSFLDQTLHMSLNAGLEVVHSACRPCMSRITGGRSDTRYTTKPSPESECLASISDQSSQMDRSYLSRSTGAESVGDPQQNITFDRHEFDLIRSNVRKLWMSVDSTNDWLTHRSDDATGDHKIKLKPDSHQFCPGYATLYSTKTLDEPTKPRPTSTTQRHRPQPSSRFLVTKLHSMLMIRKEATQSSQHSETDSIRPCSFNSHQI